MTSEPICFFALSGKEEPICEKSKSSDVGKGTNNPVEMDLEDVAALYWKANSLKVTGNGCLTATGQDENGNPSNVSSCLSGSANLKFGPIDSPTMSLEEMVNLNQFCTGIHLESWGYIFGIGGSGDPYEFTVSINVGIGNEKYLEDPSTAKKCYPEIFCSVEMASYEWSGVSSVRQKGKPVMEHGTAVLKINGKSYDITLYVSSGGSYGGINHAVSGSIKLQYDFQTDRKIQ